MGKQASVINGFMTVLRYCFDMYLFPNMALLPFVLFQKASDFPRTMPSHSPPRSFKLLRAKLDELGYFQPLATDSVPLVEALLSDLLATTGNLRAEKERARAWERQANECLKEMEEENKRRKRKGEEKRTRTNLIG